LYLVAFLFLYFTVLTFIVNLRMTTFFIKTNTQSSNKHTHINKKKRGPDGPNIPRPSAITEQRDLHAS